MVVNITASNMHGTATNVGVHDIVLKHALSLSVYMTLY